MSSIPLPALDARAPQQPSILDQFSRLQAIRSIMGQQQLQQQQIQGAQLENQQRQIAVKNQQAGLEAMKQWDGKSYDDLPDLMAKNGADLNTVMTAKTGIVKLKQDMASLTKDQLANQKVQNDYLAQSIDNVKSLPAEQQPQAFEAAKADAVQRGYLDPQKAQGMQYQNPQQLDILEKSLMGHAAVIDQALKQQQTEEAKQKAAEAQAVGAKTNAEVQLASGPLAEAKYRNILQQLSAGQQVSEPDLQFAKGYELANRKTSTTSDSLGVVSSNSSGPSGLASSSKLPMRSSQQAGGGKASPQSTAGSIVDLIGQYKANPMLLSRMMYRHPEILGLVQAKYPDWDQTSYEAKNKLISGMTSGSQSKEINAINTAMGHIGVLGDAVEALKNNDIPALNRVANAFGVQVGATPVTTFKTIVHRVAPEVAKAYVGTGGSAGERGADEKDFDPSLSPAQLKSNIGTTVQLLRSKIGSLENQYKNTVGRDDFNQRFITPEAQAAFQKFAGQGGGAAGGTTRIQASDGSLHDIPTANLDKARQIDPKLKVIQ